MMRSKYKEGQKIKVSVAFGTMLWAEIIERSFIDFDYYWCYSLEDKFSYKKGERLFIHESQIKLIEKAPAVTGA